MIAYNGETLPVVSWAERTGIPANTIYDRLRHGWDAARILETPETKTLRMIERCGETRSLTDWCRVVGIAPGIVFSRLQRGWDVERSLTQSVRGSAL